MSSTPSSPLSASQALALRFKQAASDYCALIERLLRPITPPGFSLDLEITIRHGSIRVRPRSLYQSADWKDRE